jgi:hypothetical protein
MSFRTLCDAHNPENRNAGNGSDLIKHAIYLAFLGFLGPGEALRECHAGRGVYRVPPSDRRRGRLAKLARSSTGLSRAQRDAAGRLGVGLEEWYVGSALLRAEAAEPRLHEVYEWDPQTRAILRSAAGAAGAELRVRDDDPSLPFDGESHLSAALGGFGGADVVLLDPFGVWRHARHDFRRERYQRLLEHRAALPDPPSLALFFTWGNDARGEAADLEGEAMCAAVRLGRFADPLADAEARAATPANGYRALRGLIAGPLVRVRFHCDLRCAMWLVTPEPEGLEAVVYEALARLHREVLDDAAIEVAISEDS